MTELSYSGSVYTGMEQYRDASPAEVFWALSDPGTQIPEQLVANHEVWASRNEQPPWVEIIEEHPQGWGLLDFSPPLAKAAVCDGFAASHCPYSAGYCGVDEIGPTRWNNIDTTTKYYAAVCVDDGTVSDVLTYKKQSPSGCGLEASWHTVWNTTVSAGAILVHSWTSGDPSPYGMRLYDHYLSNGFLDTYNWSSRYTLGQCFL